MCLWPSPGDPATRFFADESYATYLTTRLSWLNSTLSAGRGRLTTGSVVGVELPERVPSIVYGTTAELPSASLGPSAAGEPPGGEMIFVSRVPTTAPKLTAAAMRPARQMSARARGLPRLRIWSSDAV